MKPLSLFLVVTFLVSCRGAESPTGAAIIADSSGVVIVTNSTTETAISEWSIDPEPIVRIGGDREEPGQQLFRVVGAIRLSDDRLAIANAGTYEIRYYDRSGTLSRVAGGEGGGPGEFADLRWIQKLAGDSIAAYDSRRFRLSIFDEQGEFVRSITIRPSEDVPFPVALGVFLDGSLLVRRSPGPQSPFGLQRLDFRLLRYDASGNNAAPLGEFLGDEVYFRLSETGGVSVYGVPFARSTSVAVSDTLFYVAHNDRFEIQLFSPSGSLLRLVRRTQPAAPVTDELARQYREVQLEGPASADLRRRWERVDAEIPVPQTAPAFGAAPHVRGVRSLVVDDLGNLWVLEYTWRLDEATRWCVFDERGVGVAWLTLPARREPLHIGADHMVLRVRDELDVESVQVHRIVR